MLGGVDSQHAAHELQSFFCQMSRLFVLSCIYTVQRPSLQVEAFAKTQSKAGT